MAKDLQVAERDLEKLGQLTLDLRLPWDGYSPRVLTRAYETFSFTAEGMGRLDQDASHVGDLNIRGGQLALPFPSIYGMRYG